MLAMLVSIPVCLCWSLLLEDLSLPSPTCSYSAYHLVDSLLLIILGVSGAGLRRFSGAQIQSSRSSCGLKVTCGDSELWSECKCVDTGLDDVLWGECPPRRLLHQLPSPSPRPCLRRALYSLWPQEGLVNSLPHDSSRAEVLLAGSICPAPPNTA